MRQLFIDTHSEKITIALKDGKKINLKEALSVRSHSEMLMPTLKELLDENNISLKDVDEIAVVNGPGSFTGVRIGVTVAKTIAYSLEIPIKTITSLEMFGESSDEDFDIVCVEDSKGCYTAFKKGNTYSEFSYRKKDDYESYISSNSYRVLSEKRIDMEKIFEYLKEKDYENPHLVNPVYIKEIEALK